MSPKPTPKPNPAPKSTQAPAPKPNAAPTGPLLLFDGHCAFCNGWVRFVLRHERRPELAFVPLQSPLARRLLAPRGIDPQALDSVYLYRDGQLWARSEAALRIAATLRAPWRWLAGLRHIPRRWRDAGYDLVGRWRYRLFGRSEYCAARLAGQRHRFLTEIADVEPQT